jgi:hypothetical protein
MKLSERLEDYRVRNGPYASLPGQTFGFFLVPGPCGEALYIIACDGDVDGPLGGWEHVSVSTARRLPNWREMCFVKDRFWGEGECVVQYHPPKTEYVNNVDNVLHLWRWTRGKFPMPPSLLVGLKEFGEIKSLQQAEAMRAEAERQAKELSGDERRGA